MIVILRKDGREKTRLDPKTKETIKGEQMKKSLTPKQKNIAFKTNPKDKITETDFKALKKRRNRGKK